MSKENQLLPDWLLKAAEQALARQSDALRDASDRWQRGLKTNWQDAMPADAAEWARNASSSMESISARAMDFARAWWTLNQDYYRDLSALGTEFARQSMDEWQRAGSDARAGRRDTHDYAHDYTHRPPPTETPPRQIPLTLTGPVGSVAAQTVVLENPQDAPLSIGFLISDACDADGGPDFHLPLTIEPSRFDLAPGDERAVTLRLALPGDRFIAGRRYTATVRVDGYPGLSLALLIAPTAVDDTRPVKPRPEKPNAQTPPKKQAKPKTTGAKKPTSTRTTPRKPRTNG